MGSAAPHLRVLRSSDSGPRSRTIVGCGLPRGAGAFGGFVSPDLSPGKRVPSGAVGGGRREPRAGPTPAEGSSEPAGEFHLTPTAPALTGSPLLDPDGRKVNPRRAGLCQPWGRR